MDQLFAFEPITVVEETKFGHMCPGASGLLGLAAAGLLVWGLAILKELYRTHLHAFAFHFECICLLSTFT